MSNFEPLLSKQTVGSKKEICVRNFSNNRIDFRKENCVVELKQTQLTTFKVVEFVFLTVVKTDFVIELNNFGKVDILSDFVDAETSSDATDDDLVYVVLPEQVRFAGDDGDNHVVNFTDDPFTKSHLLNDF